MGENTPSSFNSVPVALLHVNGNHFDMGMLRDSCLPPLYKQWNDRTRGQPEMLPINEGVKEGMLMWDALVVQ